MNKVPILTADMISPVGALISTSEAKRLYKVWLIKIGQYSVRSDKDLIDERTAMFVDEIRQHEFMLIDEVKTIKESDSQEITEIKNKIGSLKKQQTSSVEKFAELQDEIDAYEEQLDLLCWPIKKAMEALDKFKKDKRQFLVDYINFNWQDHDAWG